MRKTRRENFIAEICFKNHKYTPRDVREYIKSIRQIKFINPKSSEVLIQESIKKLDSLMLKHRIRSEDILQAEDTFTSLAGKELAELVSSHYDKTIKLINE